MNNNNKHDLLYINVNSLSRELCNNIINLFEQSGNRYDGQTFGGTDKNVKDTTDLVITNAGSIWDRINKTLFNELNHNVRKYVKKYNNKVSETYQIFGGTNYLITETMQVQKYNKNVGKYVYHQDYSCDWKNKKMRHLTFLWYLNDVEEGGETEFWGQYGIKPEAGKLILFPASWTFPHKANVPISSDKYIITGWLWQHYNTE